MTRDEMLDRLRGERALFDAKVALVRPEAFDAPPAGFEHSPREVIAHVTAYEALIVERIEAARRRETTAFSRDRAGWEAFNEETWRAVHSIPAAEVMRRAGEVFAALVAAVEGLTDADLVGDTELTRHLDPEWLLNRSLAEMIEIDGFGHYPDHYAVLDEAASPGTV